MASGNTLAIFTPHAGESPAANYATQDVRNNHPVLDFDASADETIYFSGVMPGHYDGGGVTVHVIGAFSSDTNNAHTCDVDIAFERIGDGQQDLDVDGFAAVQTATLTVPATSGLTDVANAAFANGAEMDSVVADEAYRISVMVDTSDSDFTGDFELLAIHIKET